MYYTYVIQFSYNSYTFLIHVYMYYTFLVRSSTYLYIRCPIITHLLYMSYLIIIHVLYIYFTFLKHASRIFDILCMFYICDEHIHTYIHLYVCFVFDMQCRYVLIGNAVVFCFRLGDMFLVSTTWWVGCRRLSKRKHAPGHLPHRCSMPPIVAAPIAAAPATHTTAGRAASLWDALSLLARWKSFS